MTAPSQLVPAVGGPTSSALLRALAEQAPDWIVVLDHDFRLLFCNAAFSQAFHRHFGRPLPAVGEGMRGYLASLPPEQGTALERAWSQALQGQEQTITCLLGTTVRQQDVYEIRCAGLNLDGVEAAFQIGRRVSQREARLAEELRRNAMLEAEVADLSGRLQHTNEILQERRARLAAALSVADAGTFRHDLRQQQGYWDEALHQSFGVEYREQPWPLAEFLQIVHPHDRSGVRASLEGAAQEQGPCSGVFRVVHRNGEVRWLQYRGRVFTGEDGAPAYMIGACADITALKQAEQALKEREQWLRNLADHMPVIVWIQARDLSLQYVNQRWCEYGGLDLQASRNSGWRQLVHPEDMAAINAAMAEAGRSKQLFEVECRVRRASDGAYRWHLVRSVPHLNSEGQLERWYGTAVDIEDRVQSQARLEQLMVDLEQVNQALVHGLARFESVVSSLSDGLVLFDAQGNRVILNPAARRLHGMPDGVDAFEERSENIKGFDVRDLEGKPVPLEDWPSSRALRGETFSGQELRLRRLDSGSEWIASYSGGPVLDEAGRQVYAVITFHDVSKQRAAEQALQTAVQARDRFLSIASHELRTPLTTLVMQLQMARRRIDPATNTAPSPAELVKTLDIANRQALRLAKLVDDLLDVSRSGMDKLEFHFQAVDLGELVAEVAGQFAIALEQAGCQLTLQLAKGVVGEWDAARLEQVVGNLLSNAIKYASGTAIQITLQREGDQAVLQVRDHGPGIPGDNRDKIFDRFERYVSDTAVTGLGLGLFLAREIVRGHGGSIELASPDGPGVCFIVTLPLQAKSTGDAGAQTPPPP